MLSRLIGLSALCASALGTSAWAQAVSPQIELPSSSIVRPADAGLRAHTNIKILRLANPTAAPPALYGVQPQLPPSPGVFFETPASLACVYGLVPKTLGCNPQ